MSSRAMLASKYARCLSLQTSSAASLTAAISSPSVVFSFCSPFFFIAPPLLACLAHWSEQCSCRGRARAALFHDKTKRPLLHTRDIAHDYFHAVKVHAGKNDRHFAMPPVAPVFHGR